MSEDLEGSVAVAESGLVGVEDGLDGFDVGRVPEPNLLGRGVGDLGQEDGLADDGVDGHVGACVCTPVFPDSNTISRDDVIVREKTLPKDRERVCLVKMKSRDSGGANV